MANWIHSVAIPNTTDRRAICTSRPDSTSSSPEATVGVASLISAVPGDAMALSSGTSSLTYAALNRTADRLAAYLGSRGVSAEVPVGICLDRSFNQVTAVLATLRAGGAFVPLDPAWPAERLSHVLADCEAAFVITDSTLSARLPDTPRILLDHDAAAIAAAIECNPVEPTPEQLAYIIYTSGSTGVPKGVEITHGGLQHLVAWHLAAFAVNASDRMSHLAGLGFDAAVWEVWPALAAGACVVLADETTRTSPALLQAWLTSQDVTIAFVPTILAEPLMAMPWAANVALRILLTGGDTLHSAPPSGLPFTVFNNYGPAECTVVATSGIVSPGGVNQSIGCAIDGASVLLLDPQGDAVPAGGIGEIHIGGAGVGRGYRNQPALTASRFIVDRDGERRFRTGDFGVVLPDGQIGFRGREDGQEKIRGQRVELDEIACVLNRHPSVAASAVLARGLGDEKHLVAYVLPREGCVPSARTLQEFAAAALPAALIPSLMVGVTSLPMTGNGKLDRGALPEPTPEILLPDVGSRAASGPVEETLLATIRTLLGTDRVGVDDNFFFIGGHSLLGTQLVLRARQVFGVELTLRHLFEASSVAALAVVIEGLLLAEIEAMSEDEALRQIAE